MPQTSCYPECRHIMPGGRTCHSPALKGKLLCHHHSRQCTLVEANRIRNHSIALPPLEDRVAIQMSLDEIIAALSAGKVTRRVASTYLYAVQLGMRNLAQLEKLPPPDPVELRKHTHGDILAAEPSLPDPAPNPSSDEIANDVASEDQSTTASPQEDAPTEPIPADAPSSLLLDELNTHASHEYDPEPPLPLTKKERELKRRNLEAQLRNFREARTHYQRMADLPVPLANENPAMVLAYVQKNINKVEQELEDLTREETPDPPLPRDP